MFKAGDRVVKNSEFASCDPGSGRQRIGGESGNLLPRYGTRGIVIDTSIAGNVKVEWEHMVHGEYRWWYDSVYISHLPVGEF